jgi:DNA mismatch repair protein MutS2
VKEFLHTLEETIAAEDTGLEEEQHLLEEDTRRLESVYSGEKSSKKSPGIRPGTEVLAGAYKRPGTVLRADKKGSWIVEIGSLRMSFPEQDLHPLPPSKTEKKPIIALPDLASDTVARLEISLRGMHLEEALQTLQRQIDAAVLSGLLGFSVVHGKGEGILQQGVHAFLKTQPQVADYYFSRPEMGGFGRTEVVLKS